MAMALQLSTFVAQYLASSSHTSPPKSPNALRMGILSTAMINTAGLIYPAETHGGVVIHGVASRDLPSAQKYAKKYSIPHSYGSYTALLADPAIEAVYISLPNGMHAEWAIKSLEAGKHVLLEKPFASNAEEARKIVEAAKKCDKVCLEAFHWRFHPAAHVVDAIVASRRYGDVKRTSARMTTPTGSIPMSDVRWQYDLAGGALMDMTYVLSSTRYFLRQPKLEEVLEATSVPSPNDNRVDQSTTATLRFTSSLSSSPVTSTIYADMSRSNCFMVIPRLWELPSITIECEEATIYFYNFMMPHLYHYISITDKGGNVSYQKHYFFGPKWGVRGESWWSTYRYQLEAFVDKVRGREPACWVDLEDSVQQMEAIDKVYEMSGLGKRKGTQEAAGGEKV